jgi:hypothetical protein
MYAKALVFSRDALVITARVMNILKVAQGLFLKSRSKLSVVTMY